MARVAVQAPAGSRSLQGCKTSVFGFFSPGNAGAGLLAGLLSGTATVGVVTDGSERSRAATKFANSFGGRPSGTSMISTARAECRATSAKPEDASEGEDGSTKVDLTTPPDLHAQSSTTNDEKKEPTYTDTPCMSSEPRLVTYISGFCNTEFKIL